MERTEEEKDLDDEDEWYARMENAAFNTGVDGYLETDVLQPNDSNVEDDTDYFEKLDKVAKSGNHESAFVDESSTVWQSMLRKVAGDRSTSNEFLQVTFTDELQLSLCRQWLFSHIPSSFTLYHMISSWYLSIFPDRSVYVDHYIHPSVIFTCLYKQNTCYLHCTIFSSAPLSGGALPSVVNWLYNKARNNSHCKSLYIAHTENELFETYFASDKRFKMEWVEICKTYVCDPCARNIFHVVSSSLPPGYEYCDLR